MEDVVKSLIEKEVRLIMKRLSRANFKDTFGILKGKKKSIDEIEADIYDEWEVRFFIDSNVCSVILTP